MKKSFFEEGYVGLIGVSMIGAVSFELFYCLLFCVFFVMTGFVFNCLSRSDRVHTAVCSEHATWKLGG